MGFMVSGFGGGFFLVVINDVEQLGVGFAIYFSPDDQGVNHFLLPHPRSLNTLHQIDDVFY